MAKLKELIDFMAENLGDKDLKPDVYARPLRREGLLRTGARGPGAPEMTAQDCTNLLLAIMGSAPASDADKTVKGYRDLVLRPRPVEPRGHRSTRPDRTRHLEYLRVEGLKTVPYFGEALELLILSAMKGELGDSAASWKESASLKVGYDQPGVTVRLLGPAPGAIITAPMLGYEQPLRYAPLKEDAPSGDLVRSGQITHQTILRLGEFLR